MYITFDVTLSKNMDFDEVCKFELKVVAVTEKVLDRNGASY